jgi:hypothetical protein
MLTELLRMTGDEPLHGGEMRRDGDAPVPDGQPFVSP